MSNGRKRAPKTWARVIEIKAKLARKGATPAEIIATVREKYPEIIRAERDDLIYLGLTTVVNSVCNLKWGSGSSVQRDLFEGYDVPRTVTLRGADNAGNARSIKKNVDAMTKAELGQYLADHEMPPKQSRHIKELTRLFEFIREHGSDTSTVTECWIKARAQVVAL